MFRKPLAHSVQEALSFQCSGNLVLPLFKKPHSPSIQETLSSQCSRRLELPVFRKPCDSNVQETLYPQCSGNPALQVFRKPCGPDQVINTHYMHSEVKTSFHLNPVFKKTNCLVWLWNTLYDQTLQTGWKIGACIKPASQTVLYNFASNWSEYPPGIGASVFSFQAHLK